MTGAVTTGKDAEVKREAEERLPVKPVAKEPVPIEQLKVAEVPSMKSEFDSVTGKYTLVVAEHLNATVAKELVAAGGGEVECSCDDAGVTVFRITIAALTDGARAAKEAKEAEAAAKEHPEQPIAEEPPRRAGAGLRPPEEPERPEHKPEDKPQPKPGAGRR